MITYSFCILDLHCVISESKKKIFSSDIVEVRKGMHTVSIPLKHSIALTGDIRVDFFNRPKMKRKVPIQIKLMRFIISHNILNQFVRSVPRKNCFIFGSIHSSYETTYRRNTIMESYQLSVQLGHWVAMVQLWNYQWLCRTWNPEPDP